MNIPPEKPKEEAKDPPSKAPRQYRQMEAAIAEELRCLQCDAPVPNVVCGRKSPCPACGFPYPLGDCSDLAEN